MERNEWGSHRILGGGVLVRKEERWRGGEDRGRTRSLLRGLRCRS